MSDVKFPDVEVQLNDGNVFAIIGAASAGLKKARYPAEAKDFSPAALRCSSYDEVLALCMQTVNITTST